MCPSPTKWFPRQGTAAVIPHRRCPEGVGLTGGGNAGMMKKRRTHALDTFNGPVYAAAMTLSCYQAAGRLPCGGDATETL